MQPGDRQPRAKPKRPGVLATARKRLQKGPVAAPSCLPDGKPVGGVDQASCIPVSQVRLAQAVSLKKVFVIDEDNAIPGKVLPVTFRNEAGDDLND